MRAVRCKAIARLVYGDISRRSPVKARPHQVAFLKGLRAIYRQAKRSWRDGACMRLIMETNG